MEALKRLGVYFVGTMTVLVGGYGWWAEYYHWPAISFVDFRDDRVALLAGIDSYQELTAFQKGPAAAECGWIHDTLASESPSDTPPYVVETLTCPRMRDLDFEGRMEVSFFNGRLMATAFYPRDAEAYREAFEAKYGVKVNRFSRISVGDDREVSWMDQDQSRPHLVLGDSRLLHEQALWNKRYR